MSPNEKIIYSFLVSKSITRYEDAFDFDGTCLRMEDLESQLDENGNFCNMCEITKTMISQELNMTRKTVIDVMWSLSCSGYIVGNKIYVLPRLLDGGYFELRNAGKIKGELLIFYSFLYDKARKYDFVIDTYKSKIAEQFGKSTVAVTKLLNRLYSVGLAKRIKDNKLLIYT